MINRTLLSFKSIFWLEALLHGSIVAIWSTGKKTVALSYGPCGTYPHTVFFPESSNFIVHNSGGLLPLWAAYDPLNNNKQYGSFNIFINQLKTVL